MAFRRFGAVTIPFPSGPRRLELFWMEGYAGGLFLPFRDATNGRETYGAGRYLLDAAKSADLGPGRGAEQPRPRLQLRVPAVVRVRPEVGVSARSAGEPARPRGPRRRTARLSATVRRDRPDLRPAPGWDCRPGESAADTPRTMATGRPAVRRSADRRHGELGSGAVPHGLEARRRRRAAALVPRHAVRPPRSRRTCPAPAATSSTPGSSSSARPTS